MCIFQPITLHRATNSPKLRNKIRLAFHFVERKDLVHRTVFLKLTMSLSLLRDDYNVYSSEFSDIFRNGKSVQKKKNSH